MESVCSAAHLLIDINNLSRGSFCRVRMNGDGYRSDGDNSAYNLPYRLIDQMAHIRQMRAILL